MRKRCTLLAVITVAVLPTHHGAAEPIIIESQDRSAYASAWWECCPWWPAGAPCRTDSVGDEFRAVGLGYVSYEAYAGLSCEILPGAHTQHVASAEHTSVIDVEDSRFTMFGFAFSNSTNPAEVWSRFYVSFLVLEPSRFRLSARVTIPPRIRPPRMPDAITATVRLIGENTEIEFSAMCCDEEQVFERVGILSPGRYETLAQIERGPNGWGIGNLQYELDFSEPVGVEQRTWSSIKSLYQR
jgi:hypothetical protein